MRSLYNQYNAAVGWDATALSDATDRFAEDAFKEFESRGYNPREISHIMQMVIGNIEAEHVLRAAMIQRKEKRS